MPGLSQALRRIALFLRQVAAFGALVLCVRILWLSAASGIAHSQAKVEVSPRSTSQQKLGNGPLPVDTIQNTHRPDLDELTSMVGKVAPEPETTPPAPVPVLRRILVDIGPPRSEVFVGKRSVGKTPYGGQIACTSGEEIKVQVLPTRGVPIERRVTCSGDTLLVQE